MSDIVHLPMVVKQVASERLPRSSLRAGTVVLVRSTEHLVFGRVVLIASSAGRSFDAVGVVIGEPVHWKRKQHRRQVFITNLLPTSTVKLRRPAPSTERLATQAEYRDVREHARKSVYDFVSKAATLVMADLGPATQTTERRCARFIVECANQLKGFEGATEVPVAGAKGSATKNIRNSRADALIRVPERIGRKRVLVVETEWKAIGGAESAAQAWEYAARLKHRGGFADGKRRIGLSSNEVQRATLWPVVVANNVPDLSLAAEELGVPLMSYPEFLALLRSQAFQRLQPLRK